VFFGVLEGETGTRDEILHGARDEDLGGAGQRSDTRTNDDREAAGLARDGRNLPGVQTHPYDDPERFHRRHDSCRARRCPRRAIEALSTSTIDLSDVETACTGDEAAAGDASCGPGATVGELAPNLSAAIQQVSCATGAPGGGGTSGSLQSLQSAAALGIIQTPDEIVCLRIGIAYPPAPATSDTAIQIAQTDQVTWRFAFDGTTS